MATQGGAPKKFFFYENALSGSIHSTYQLPSLQTDQNPTLGQPSRHEIMLFTVTLCLTFLHLSPYLKHFSFASSGQLLYSSKHLLLGAGVVPLLVSVVTLPENVAAHIGLN